MTGTPPETQMKEQTGWQARLSMDMQYRSDRSVPMNCSRKGPLTFQRPFYPEKDVCHLYLLHPPGGIVGGDRIELDIRMLPKAHGLFTTPGATKFYRSVGPVAQQYQTFFVEKNSVLEWFPQETILFNLAKADIQTTVYLETGARFIGWDITCLGRPAGGHAFHSGRLENRLSIFENKRPLFMDRLRLDPQRETGCLINSIAGLQGFPVVGCFVANAVTDAIHDALKPEIQPAADQKNCLIAVTRIRELLIARYLGNDPEQARQFFISIWQHLRPAVLGKPVCLPRIWAT